MWKYVTAIVLTGLVPLALGLGLLYVGGRVVLRCSRTDGEPVCRVVREIGPAVWHGAWVEIEKGPRIVVENRNGNDIDFASYTDVAAFLKDPKRREVSRIVDPAITALLWIGAAVAVIGAWNALASANRWLQGEPPFGSRSAR